MLKYFDYAAAERAWMKNWLARALSSGRFTRDQRKEMAAAMRPELDAAFPEIKARWRAAHDRENAELLDSVEA